MQQHKQQTKDQMHTRHTHRTTKARLVQSTQNPDSIVDFAILRVISM